MGREDINELNIYQLGQKIGQDIYQLAHNWETFERNTIGFQLVRSADSISANISEGYGRYSFKEQRQFCYIARGSLYETKTWLQKAFQRVHKDRGKILEISSSLNELHIKLNAYIKYIDRNITT